MKKTAMILLALTGALGMTSVAQALPPISLGNRRVNLSESGTKYLIYQYMKSAEMV